MKTVYLMCGLAFAGKSTLASQISKRTGARIISLDEINAQRNLHGGMGIPDHEWGITHQVALQRMKQMMEHGGNIIVDDTNCFRWLRDSYRSLAEPCGYLSIVIYVEATIDLVLRRASANVVSPNRPVVLPEILQDLAAKFEPPDPDEAVIRYSTSESMIEWIERHF